MSIKEFIAELKTSLRGLDSAHLIDEISIYKWVSKALKQFGGNIMENYGEVLIVNKGKTKLPDNFYTLKQMFLCEPLGYKVIGDKAQIGNTKMWVERIERDRRWDNCTYCEDKIKEEKLIIEQVFIGDSGVKFYYNNPVPIKIGKGGYMPCAKGCNQAINSKYEVIKRGDYLYFNFDTGYVSIQYQGIPKDEDGLLVIPESNNGYLVEYLEYYVKMKIMEELLLNGDAPNKQTMFNYFVSKESEFKTLALTDVKFGRLTPDSFKKLRNRNRQDLLKYELMFPKL